MKRDSKIEALRVVPGLSGVDARRLRGLASLVDEVSISAGGMLTREGFMGREAFVIVEGEAEVRIDGEVVARVSAGDFVGEMAMLENNLRTATVRAVTPLRALVIGPQAFGAFVRHDEVAREIAVQLSRRLRRAEVGVAPVTVG